jgi:hypothetical protein
MWAKSRLQVPKPTPPTAAATPSPVSRRASSQAPSPATAKVAAIVTLLAMTAGRTRNSRLGGYSAPAWLLPSSGMPEAAHGFQVGRCPLSQARAETRNHGMNSWPPSAGAYSARPAKPRANSTTGAATTTQG